jgi:hypothetical protein
MSNPNQFFDPNHATTSEAERMNRILSGDAAVIKKTVISPTFENSSIPVMSPEQEREMLRENRRRMEEKLRREGKLK